MTLSSPLTAAEIASVRRPYREAGMLPPRVFHDPAVFAFEQDRWFARDWLCVGRAEQAATPGGYFLVRPGGENVIVLRGADGVLRAFYNVCRHRGSTLLEEPCGAVSKILCPYHAWVYDVDGSLRRARHTEGLSGFDPAANGLVPVRCETWQAFVFVSLDPAAPPLPGMAGEDLRRVFFYLLWPNLLASLHPDYLMTHQVWPVEPGRSTVHCDWYFHPDAVARPGFDAGDAVEFWDLTNRQDWHVCELQQQGTASRGYTPGRYSTEEDAVHAFDLMCMDRYAMDGVRSRRDSRTADGRL